MFNNEIQQLNTSCECMTIQIPENQNRNLQSPYQLQQIYSKKVLAFQTQNDPPISNAIPQIQTLNQQLVKSYRFSKQMISQQPLKSIRNQVQSYYQSPQKYIRNEIPSIRIQSPQSPQGLVSHKSNVHLFGQKPAFIEYLPPVYVPHIEPVITQTVVNKFEDKWNNRIQGVEYLFTSNQQSVKPEVIEIRGEQNEDNGRVFELQNELNRTKQQLEDRDKQIMDLKSQIQFFIENQDIENQQSRNSSANLVSELQIKINNLQSTIQKLQLELKQSDQSLENCKLHNLQLQNDIQNYIISCQIKDETIYKLNQQIKQLNLDIQSNMNGSNGQVIELQIQIITLQQTIDNLKNESQFNLELFEKLQKENGQLKIDVQNYIKNSNQKNDQIQKLEQEISELNQQMDLLNEEITTIQSIKTYEEEAKIWKQKFKELNDAYHVCQEKLMVMEAEYESLQKQQQSSQKIINQTTIVQQNSSRKIRYASDYFSNSNDTSNDSEKKQNYQQTLQP